MKLAAALCSLVAAQLVYLQLAEAQPDLSMHDTSYNVTKEGEGYEVRDYSPSRWVCHEKSRSRPTMIGLPDSFSPIAKYFEGDNKEGEKVVVAPPLTMIMKQSKTTGKWITEMCLYLPKAQEMEPPIPSDAEVSIKERPAMTVFVRRMGGLLRSPEQWESQAMLLEQALQGKESADVSTYYMVEYNPPDRLLKRRNEVWFMKKEKM